MSVSVPGECNIWSLSLFRLRCQTQPGTETSSHRMEVCVVSPWRNLICQSIHSTVLQIHSLISSLTQFSVSVNIWSKCPIQFLLCTHYSNFTPPPLVLHTNVSIASAHLDLAWWREVQTVPGVVLLLNCGEKCLWRYQLVWTKQNLIFLIHHSCDSAVHKYFPNTILRKCQITFG